MYAITGTETKSTKHDQLHKLQRRNFSTSLYSKSVHSHKELCCFENTPPHDNTFFVVFNHFSPVIRLWNNVQITCESWRSCYCVQFFYNGKSFIGYTKKLQKNPILIFLFLHVILFAYCLLSPGLLVCIWISFFQTFFGLWKL